jgi:lysyl-tRNA synthetase class 2
MVEWIQSYADYTDVMEFLELTIAGVAEQVLGTTRIERGGRTIDLAPPWRRVTLRDAIRDATGIDVDAATHDELAAQVGDAAAPGASWGVLVGALAKRIEARLVEPTFVYEYPWELCLLARGVEGDARLVECFEAFVGGVEIATGNTECNDPDEQRARFRAHREQHPGSAADVHPLDEDFMRALEQGLLPCAGAGLGVDRVVMLLTERETLREVLLFPALREAPPREGPSREGPPA